MDYKTETEFTFEQQEILHFKNSDFGLLREEQNSKKALLDIKVLKTKRRELLENKVKVESKLGLLKPQEDSIEKRESKLILYAELKNLEKELKLNSYEITKQRIKINSLYGAGLLYSKTEDLVRKTLFTDPIIWAPGVKSITGVKCEMCDSMNAEKSINPYDAEINGVQSYVTVCENCLGLLAEEI